MSSFKSIPSQKLLVFLRRKIAKSLDFPSSQRCRFTSILKVKHTLFQPRRPCCCRPLPTTLLPATISHLQVTVDHSITDHGRSFTSYHLSMCPAGHLQ